MYVEYTLYTPYLPHNNGLFTFSAYKMADYTHSYSALSSVSKTDSQIICLCTLKFP